MESLSKREIALEYLRLYAARDLNGVSQLFADDIILRDWKIYVEGKETALKETLKNFDSVDTIEIEVLATYENDSAIAAELKITIDSEEELFVVDIIDINAAGKINSIRAYLGRGDE